MMNSVPIIGFEGSTEQAPSKEDESAPVAATQELDTLRLLSPPVDEAQTHDDTPLAVDGAVMPPSPEDAETGHYSYAIDADTAEYKRSYALNFASRKKPKALLAMTLGMQEFQGILERPPMSVIKRKELTDTYVPKADDFKHEIKRRAHFYMNVPDESNYFVEELKRPHPLKTKRSNIVLPQPNQWLNSNLRNWLVDRPMKPNGNDLNFLRFQVHKALEYLSKENNCEGADIVKDLPETPMGAITPMVNVMTSPVPPTPVAPVVEEIATEPYLYACSVDSEEFKRSAASTFLQKESKPRILIAIALGMTEYQGLLDRPPFSIIKRKDLTDDFIPRAEDYRFEIKRRAHFFMNIEDETNYYTRELKRKNPLENMRGIVALPQPNQWKLQALKGWLAERPLKPNKEDGTFLQQSITKFLDALNGLVQNDPQVMETPGRKSPHVKTIWASLDTSSVGSGDQGGSSSSKRRETLLLECITKQDAILGAVTKQTQQQTILNKITVLNQAISGYQQEISSLRSTLNDAENRILKIEMRIAEVPESEERLSMIIAKQHEAKNQAESKLKDFQQLIQEARTKIETNSQEMDHLGDQEEESPISSRKRKLEEDEIGENEAGGNNDEMAAAI